MWRIIPVPAGPRGVLLRADRQGSLVQPDYLDARRLAVIYPAGDVDLAIRLRRYPRRQADQAQVDEGRRNAMSPKGFDPRQ